MRACDGLRASDHIIIWPDSESEVRCDRDAPGAYWHQRSAGLRSLRRAPSSLLLVSRASSIYPRINLTQHNNWGRARGHLDGRATMDKFIALEPVRLHNSSTQQPASKSTSSANRLSIFSPLTPRPAQFLNALRQRGPAPFERIGRLPADLHILVLTYVAVPDLPAYARACRATGALVRDERVWEARWRLFGLDDELGNDVQGYAKRAGDAAADGKGKGHLHEVLDVLEERSRERNGLSKSGAPPTLTVDIGDDDFGDFASGGENGTALHAPADEMGDFVGACYSFLTFYLSCTTSHNALRRIFQCNGQYPSIGFSLPRYCDPSNAEHTSKAEISCAVHPRTHVAETARPRTLRATSRRSLYSIPASRITYPFALPKSPATGAPTPALSAVPFLPGEAPPLMVRTRGRTQSGD